MRFILLSWLAACGGPVDGPGDGAVEVCGNAIDDDGNGASDCDDNACACPELCTTDGDEDRDGVEGCADSDCDGSCPEVCDDTRDNDGDGSIDCDDSDCSDPACPEICGDGRDNDGDGASDCSDVDCVDPSCEELCTDARDNDADGATDCEDADCDGLCPETCEDGRDNDLDGFADCDDPQCEVACIEDCVNDLDDDADALIDCIDPECSAECDTDNDGFLNGDHGGDDCDDLDPEVNPDANEVCNGVDDDCNGATDLEDPGVDPATQQKFYDDDDFDSFGDRFDVGTWACVGDLGTVPDNTDCNDADPDVSPAALEVCDGVDNDCDSLKDDADPSVDLATTSTWYPDNDGDGYGDIGSPEFVCNPPAGYVDNGDDCNDDDPLLGPPSDWLPDLDGDDYGVGVPYGVVTCIEPAGSWAAAVHGVDCDDTDPTNNPGATEVCDSRDNDCDLYVDDEDDSIDLATASEWHVDFDEDGYGSKVGPLIQCLAPVGWVADKTDCDDGDYTLNPGAIEVCDGLDNDCDTKKDDADPSVDLSTATNWYLDADSDGFGDPLGLPLFACAPPPGRSADNTDCDDSDPSVFGPGDWVADLDLDGWGAGPGLGLFQCDSPGAGFTSEYLDEDCDEGDALIYPTAPEICEDLVDQDCNGLDKSCFPIQDPSYSADAVFIDKAGSTVMTVAWDGTNYWSTSGGGVVGNRLAEYDAFGAPLGTFAPSIDFRSVFTIGDGVGQLYSREYAQKAIEEQGAVGSFHPFVTLSGGTLDIQASVCWDDTRGEFVAQYNGTVSKWDISGAHTGDLKLIGYGSSGLESSYPQNRGVAVAGGWYFTYDSGTLSGWDETGARVGKTSLLGGGTSFDSNFSLSYANGRIWVVDAALGTWRGYPIDI